MTTRRSEDDAITAQVQRRLRGERGLDVSGVAVETAKRIVTLKGRIPTEEERMQAVKLALETAGVFGVLDELAVGPAAAAAAQLASPGAAMKR